MDDKTRRGRGKGRKASSERLVLIGDGPVSDLLRKRGTAAGWSVEGVAIYPAEGAEDGAALSDGSAEALDEATIVAVTTAAGAHPALSILLRGHLGRDALLLLVPGQPGGALQFATALGPDAPVVAETSWVPVVETGDGKGRGAIEIASLPLAAVPAGKAKAVARRIAPLINAEPVKSARWTALHSPDLVLKTVPMVVGANAEDERLGRLLDGPAQGLVTALELEKARIAASFGLEVPATAEWLSGQLGTSPETLSAALGPMADLKVPPLSDEHWLADLAPFGLVPLQALAAEAGVDAPCATAMVTVADALLGNDYGLGGRTAAAMGMG